MSTTVSTSTTAAVQSAPATISDTEWIVIVVVLVIILIVLIISIAKCLEIGKSGTQKSLLQDAPSLRSETVRSTTTRSIASTRSRQKNGKMRKLPLNAEITRFSAGRVSRSAEYGVVIKDIKKTVQGDEPGSTQMSPPPSYHEQVNTLNTYKQDTLSSPPNGQLILNQQYASQNLAPSNSKAVFAAPEELYSKPYAHIAQNERQASMRAGQPNPVMVDRMYPILTQPAVILQQ